MVPSSAMTRRSGLIALLALTCISCQPSPPPQLPPSRLSGSSSANIHPSRPPPCWGQCKRHHRGLAPPYGFQPPPSGGPAIQPASGTDLGTISWGVSGVMLLVLLTVAIVRVNTRCDAPSQATSHRIASQGGQCREAMPEVGVLLRLGAADGHRRHMGAAHHTGSPSPPSLTPICSTPTLLFPPSDRSLKLH